MKRVKKIKAKKITFNKINISIKKACQSVCNHKVSAIAFSRKGDIIETSFNTKQFLKKGGGVHAEMRLMRKYKTKIKSILICRVNNSGKPMAIDPCENCEKEAKKLGIRIYSVHEIL